MSFDEKKYLEDHKKTWKTFVNLSIKGSVVIVIILALMAIFLTN
ncbi:MAG: aa3-type cytochrome c oxidase subunit IV [Rickettsiales bacterium]|nr:aa3-type cytochrome c oxidase subunit IV [Rickettsiales bacterium]